MSERALFAITHLRLRLRPVNRALRAAVGRRAAQSAKLDRPDLASRCITDRQVAVLLDHIDALPAPGQGPSAEPDSGDRVIEDELRVTAARHGVSLPLDELTARFALTDFERDALLLAAAPEIDSAYERIYAYVHDDVSRRLPSVELLSSVGAASLEERLVQRRALSRIATLRRLGLLVDLDVAPTEARQELRLAPGLVDFLLGGKADLSAIAADPDDLAVGRVPEPPPHVDHGLIDRLADGLAGGELGAVGVWGGDAETRVAVVAALARHDARAVRRLRVADLPAEAAGAVAAIRAALCTAAALDAMIWVPLARDGEPSQQTLLEAVAEALTEAAVPACLSGPNPWRPACLLASRPYAEIAIGAATHAQRRAMWSLAVPEFTEGRLDLLAARFRLGHQDMRAAASFARMQAALTGNGQDGGQVAGIADSVTRAAAALSLQRSSRLTTLVRPNRSADELVLPEEQHQQVMEVAAFFDTWPRLSERWGFGRLPGSRGLKVLFTGEPGTGKTLAAEVIASQLGLALMKVDLSRMVSKWVGETEKNLDAAFSEAEASSAVLFFDEADALFGKRGEVQRGIDRYANVEVGFLLQRLEQYDGLAVLASNLKEHIDPAFARRFNVIVHFPFPARGERLRLWRLAFPPEAPLDDDVDLEVLAELEMTGASIVSAARTAALLAAGQGSDSMSADHVVQAVARQYRREARLLRPAELGPYAKLL